MQTTEQKTVIEYFILKSKDITIEDYPDLRKMYDKLVTAEEIINQITDQVTERFSKFRTRLDHYRISQRDNSVTFLHTFGNTKLWCYYNLIITHETFRSAFTITLDLESIHFEELDQECIDYCSKELIIELLKQ